MKRKAGSTKGTRKRIKSTKASPVVVDKYHPSRMTKGKRSGKKRGVSKKFYGKVMKAIHGENKQVYRVTWPSDLSDVTWSAYAPTTSTGGQATNIMGIATGLAWLAEGIPPITAERQYNSLLYHIFRDMGTTTSTSGSVPGSTLLAENSAQQSYGEPSIFLKSVNVDITLINNQIAIAGEARTIDLDVYEFICKKDIPREQTLTGAAVNGSNITSAERYESIGEVYTTYMVRTFPSRSASITANQNVTHTNLVLPYNNRMAQFNETTLGCQPFHSPMWCANWKIGRKVKIFLAPGENARMQFNYKINKKIYGKNVFSNLAIKGVTRAIGFVVNNVDRSASSGVGAFAYKATQQYNYIDVASRTDTKQIYLPTAF